MIGIYLFGLLVLFLFIGETGLPGVIALILFLVVTGYLEKRSKDD